MVQRLQGVLVAVSEVPPQLPDGYSYESLLPIDIQIVPDAHVNFV